MFSKLKRAGLSILLVITILLLPFNHVNAQTSTHDNTKTENTSQQIQTFADQKAKILTALYGTTSVQYALIDEGKIVASGVAGINDKKAKTTPTQETIYGIGSISKVFTTTAVMQLVEKGKIKLDTPVVKYLPEFKMADKRYKDITVRMLLNHSSGLMGTSASNTFLYENNQNNISHNILDKLKNSSLKADPGAFMVYCNDGFTLAELVVEKVSGISFSEYVNKYISKPLELVNTKTPKDTFNRDLLAKAYSSSFENPLPPESINIIGCGGIYSTATDLCKFAQIFMKDTSSVLSKASVEAMSKEEYLKGIWPEEEDTTLAYGLGWDCVKTYPFNKYDIQALTKGGDTLAYHGSLIVLPEENMAMAVLSSGGVSSYDQYFAQSVMLEQLKINGSIKEIKPMEAYEKPVQATISSSLLKYDGYYANTMGLIQISMKEEGILTISNPMGLSSNKETYIYTKDGNFYSKDGSTKISFVNESNGKIYLYASGYATVPGFGDTVTSGYQYQKLESNPITKKVQTAWKQRLNQKYFIINECFSSELYTQNSIIAIMPSSMTLEGYFYNSVILDANTAKVNVQIPGVYGRDLSDFKFYTKNGTNYLDYSDYTSIAEKDIKNLSLKDNFSYKIGTDGYALWYKIGKAEGKKLQVTTLPKNSSFSVFDSNMVCVFNSLVTGENTVTLPKGGYIVFAGDPKAKFSAKYVK